MSFLPSSRTKRRLLKVASLGLAGLLAGLLSGCNAADASVRTSKSQLASDPATQSNQLPKSLDQTQIPALRHPPSTRHLQYGTVRTVSQVSTGPSRS
ncbi:MAG TPA: hypothetical protein VNU92_01265 [Edaphobacter sp.]|jgi:hypothetical protein|nr:hypothetical protein [Edaphobacter sp.]